MALAGHDSINRVILLQALGLPLSRYWSLRQHPCCVNRFDPDGVMFALHSINETQRLARVPEG